MHTFLLHPEKTLDITSRECLNTLHQELEKFPYRFDLCNQLIQGYLELKDENAVNRYRRHAAGHCPTSEEFWLSWISDVKKRLTNVTGATNENELEFHIIQLYRSALALCPTADLWVLYLKFVKQRNLSSSSVESRTYLNHESHIRHIGECAVRDLGLHGTEGPKIWGAYRHFEQSLLQEILEHSHCVKTACTEQEHSTEDGSSARSCDLSLLNMAKKQAERVRSLFSRQMQLPLAGLQDLWDEYRIFEAELPPELSVPQNIKEKAIKLHETGLAEWERRKTMELQVMMSDDDKIETIQRLSSGWTNYINFEKSLKSENHKIHVCTLYLRACEDLGHLRADLWFAWFHWVLTELQDSSLASMILERAVRYHPTQCRLWTAYLSCERLRKPADVNRMYTIFLKGLKGIDVKRYPNDVVTLSKTAADCIIHSFHLGPSPLATTLTSNCESLKIMESSREVLANEVARTSVDWDFSKDILEYPSVLSLLGFPSSSSETKPVSLNQRVADIFSSAESTLSMFIFCLNELKHMKQPAHVNRLYNYVDPVFRSLRNLWKEWLILCTTTVTDFHQCESVASRMLFCTTPNTLSKLNKPNSQEDVNWKYLLNITPETDVNSSGEDWTLVAEALTFSWVSAKYHPPLDEIWALGKRLVKNDVEVFLNRWFQLSLIAEVPSIAMDVSSLLFQAQQGSPLKLSPVSTYSPLSNASSMWPEFCESTAEVSQPLLTETDTSVIEVTLNQLKSRREKRRRRYSECDSETCLSDTSSDSSSVSSVLSATPSSTLLRKRLRSVSQNSTSQQRKPSIPSLTDTTHGCLPLVSDYFNPSAQETLSDASLSEVEMIERATQCTWNGHECDGDPSLTPPVPPIISAMSPLRRRCSSSISSNSPVSLSSDVSSSVSLPYPCSSFITSAQHQSEPPENLESVCKRKKSHLAEFGKSDDEDSFERGQKKSCKDISHFFSNAEDYNKEGIEAEKSTTISVNPQIGHHYKHLASGLKGTPDDLVVFRDRILELMHRKEEKNTIYVWNLDKSVTKSDVEQLFSHCKGLLEIRMVCNRKGQFKGFCYIDFETDDDAEKAVLNSQSLIHNDRVVKVKGSDPKVSTYEEKTLFFTTEVMSLEDISLDPLSQEVSASIASETEKALSRVVRPVAIRPRTEPETHKFKGYGYIDFESSEDTQLVLKILLGKTIYFVGFDGSFSVYPSIPMKCHKPILAPHVKKNARKKVSKPIEFAPQACVLFVKNLSFSTTDEKLKAHFEQFGKVKQVQLCLNDNKQSKGYAFVTFDSEKDAFSCRMLNDTVLDGRRISVSASHRVPTFPKPSSPIRNTMPLKSKIKQRLFSTRYYEKWHPPDEAKSLTGTHPLTNNDFKKFLSPVQIETSP